MDVHALIFSAWLLGILGSFHCVGMCGPIALTLPVQHLQGWSRVAGILLYNIGRMFTYALLGFLLGWIGSQFVFFGWQQSFSIIIGSLFVVIFILALFKKRIMKNSFVTAYWNKFIVNTLALLFRKKGLTTLLFIGILNGLLPCGMVYMAVAGAAATGHAWSGAFFMAAFGFGTLPAMMTMSFAGNLFSIRFRQQIRNATPYVVGIMGLVFILRGMNLDIPYLSPALQQHGISCCHQ